MISPHAVYGARLVAVAAAIAIAGKLVQFNSIGCDAFDTDPADYMAYCDAPSHGHYDDAAHLYDLEPAVRESASEAELLVLGSSHIQVALSTRALIAFEHEHPGTRPYLMGFGNFEQDKFAERVIHELKPAPRIVVINADPFFADSESVEAKRLTDSPGLEKVNASAKRAAHTLIGTRCADDAASQLSRLVCGKASTIYRSSTDGRWVFHGTRARTDSIPAGHEFENDPELEARSAMTAERFLKLLPAEKRCVVITLVPDGHHSESLGRAVAAKVGATFIAPRVARLGTSDGSHLDSESAERWAAAFLLQLDSVLKRCG